MVQVNPINVIKLLLATFQVLNLPESTVNHKEIELAENMEKILTEAMREFNDVEMTELDTLDFQEQYKDCEAQIIEDEILHTIPEGPNSPTDRCTEDDDIDEINFDYKLRAVNYWKSAKKGKLRIDTVKQKFKRVRSISQLHRWSKSINKGGTYREKIAKICDHTLQNFKVAVAAGHVIHDRDLCRWALEAQKQIGNEDFRFRASMTWLKRFKHAHRIVSRKINKFVTKKTIESKRELEEKADYFVNDVKQCAPSVGWANVYNSDQSGFQLEIHSGRTLANEGEKQVQCVVQSISSMTHSYTIQPTISAEGKLLSPLFIVLKERTGEFGPIVEANLFRPENVYVESSVSGKLTTNHFKIWLKEVFYPNVGPHTILLIDSWSGHCEKSFEETLPHDKIVNVKKIPTGTTGKIQPLDVFGFRIWKNFVRHFSDNVILGNYDMKLHLRNNIIKLQSLIHNQFSSPRYINFFKYSWFKSGYIDQRPDSFENPVDFSYGDSCKTHCDLCENVAIIRCGWCQKSLCFKHFFEDYHYCSNYID